MGRTGRSADLGKGGRRQSMKSNGFYFCYIYHCYKILSIHYFSGNLKIILSKADYAKLQHPYAITASADHLFWTDWTEKAIFRMSKTGGEDPEVWRQSLDNIRDVHVYDASRQNGMFM